MTAGITSKHVYHANISWQCSAIQPTCHLHLCRVIYRYHPLFVVDDECTSLRYTVDNEARTTAYTSVDVPTALAEEEKDDDVVMLPSSGRLARECQELAASIVNFTYDVQSVDVLLKVKNAQVEMVEMLGSSCPTSGGLPLRAEVISASRDQEDITKLYLNDLAIQKHNHSSP